MSFTISATMTDMRAALQKLALNRADQALQKRQAQNGESDAVAVKAESPLQGQGLAMGFGEDSLNSGGQGL